MVMVMVMTVLVFASSVSLLFEFLEGCIFFEFLNIVGQIGFFLLDHFFVDRSCGRCHQLVAGFVGCVVILLFGHFIRNFARDRIRSACLYAGNASICRIYAFESDFLPVEAPDI